MDEKRRNELLKAFSESVEVWQSPSDLRLLGLRMDAETLERHGPGHRVSSETGEICYSAAWLNEEAPDAATGDDWPDVPTAKPRCIWAGTWREKTCKMPACPVHGDSGLENLRPLGNVDVLDARRDGTGEGKP